MEDKECAQLKELLEKVSRTCSDSSAMDRTYCSRYPWLQKFVEDTCKALVSLTTEQTHVENNSSQDNNAAARAKFVILIAASPICMILITVIIVMVFCLRARTRRKFLAKKSTRTAVKWSRDNNYRYSNTGIRNDAYPLDTNTDDTKDLHPLLFLKHASIENISFPSIVFDSERNPSLDPHAGVPSFCASSSTSVDIDNHDVISSDPYDRSVVQHLPRVVVENEESLDTTNTTTSQSSKSDATHTDSESYAHCGHDSYGAPRPRVPGMTSSLFSSESTYHGADTVAQTRSLYPFTSMSTSSSGSYPLLRVWDELPDDIEEALNNLDGFIRYDINGEGHLFIYMTATSVGRARAAINRIPGIADDDYLIFLQ